MNYTLKKHYEKLLSISLLNHSIANSLHFLVCTLQFADACYHLQTEKKTIKLCSIAIF